MNEQDVFAALVELVPSALRELTDEVSLDMQVYGSDLIIVMRVEETESESRFLVRITADGLLAIQDEDMRTVVVSAIPTAVASLLHGGW